MKLSKRHLAYLSVPAASIIVIGSLYLKNNVLADTGHGEEAEPAPTTSEQKMSVGVETATDASLASLNATNASWPGEILSSADVQIHPSREGQIAAWKVKIGQRVNKGQVTGRLTPPPATLELASALAERSQALVRARAQAEATQILVRDARTQLAEVQLALGKSRDASLALADKELIQNTQTHSGAVQELSALELNREASVKAVEQELSQAESLLPVKRQILRVTIERLAQRMAGELSAVGTSPVTAEEAMRMEFKRGIGVISTSSQDAYRRALANLLTDLKDGQALPDKSALAYATAALNLLSYSVPSEELPSAELTEIRTEMSEDQEAMLDALNDYQEAQTDIALKRSELAKVKAEMEKEIVGAKTNALNAQTTAQSSEIIRTKMVADTDADYAERKAELGTKLNEMNRELALAQADVRAAEAGYVAIAGGVAGQDIVALETGIISAIYKNVGDHVSPETPLAGIGSEQAQEKFIRFRVPADARLPEAGSEVKVDFPGYPFGGKKAKIIGVGLALDEQGFYSVDADFIEPVAWPVHASVRVSSIGEAMPLVLAPFTALWWNDAGTPNVWLVMENGNIRPQEVKVGKAVGDRVEIEDGLQVGDRFVARALPSMKTGQSISEGAPVETAPQEELSGDGHGHSHDE